MKKTYKNPTTVVTPILTENCLLAGTTTTLGIGTGTKNAAEALSRENEFYDETAQGGSIWDEEE